jgi:hypothetical protein
MNFETYEVTHYAVSYSLPLLLPLLGSNILLSILSARDQVSNPYITKG